MVKSYFKYRNIGLVPIVALIYSFSIIMYGIELLNNSVVGIQKNLVAQKDGLSITVMMLIVLIGAFCLLMWYIVQLVEGILIITLGLCEPEEILNVIFGGMLVQMVEKGKRYFSERKRLYRQWQYDNIHARL